MNRRCPCYNYETLARSLVRKKRRGMHINIILEIFGHLDECIICREAIYQVSRDQDSQLFIYSEPVL